MRNRRLPHWIEIQRKTEAEDPSGSGRLIVTWILQSEEKARVVPVSGEERLQVQQVQSHAMYRVTIRWRDDIAPETHRIRWLLSGDPERWIVMNIRFDGLAAEDDRFLVLDCERGVET